MGWLDEHYMTWIDWIVYIIVQPYVLEFEARLRTQEMRVSMKPDWRKAPDWAMFLAKDGSGRWYWYSEEPFFESKTDAWYIENGRSALASYEPIIDPEESLENRP